MSQPLLSSRARKPSSRYTALDPPPWNLTGMSRPMAAEGTISVSTGRPGRDVADAVAEPPATVIMPGSRIAARIPAVKRRNQLREIIVCCPSFVGGPNGPPMCVVYWHRQRVAWLPGTGRSFFAPTAFVVRRGVPVSKRTNHYGLVIIHKRSALRLDGDGLPLFPRRQPALVIGLGQRQGQLAEEHPQGRLRCVDNLEDGGRRCGGVAGLRRPLCTNLVGGLVHLFVVRQRRRALGGRAGPVRGESAGLDQRDVDPERLHLLRQRLGEPLEGPLRRVVDADVLECGDAADRRHLQDVAAALCPQVRQGGLGDPQRAEDVCFDLGPRLLLGQLLDEAEVPVACVVDDDVEPAEVVVSLFDRG